MTKVDVSKVKLSKKSLGNLNDTAIVDLSNVEIVDNDLSGAFADKTNLVSVSNINNNVTNMNGAFANCSNLKSVSNLPNSLVSMYGEATVYGMQLYGYDIDDGYGQLYFNGEYYSSVYCPSTIDTSSKLYVIKENGDVVNISSSYSIYSINASTLLIRDYGWYPSYYTHRNYSKDHYDNNVSKTFTASTFENCSSLKYAPEIPNSVTDMSWAFINCIALKEAPVIPNSVSNMSYTFTNCSRLVNAPVIPNSVTDITWTFNNCSSLINAPVIPNSVTNMSYTFYQCSNLVNAPIIPNSVTNMSYTFYQCSNLVNAPIIPNSVSNMSWTFAQCAQLVNAPVIPNSVTNMDRTFGWCWNLVNAPAIPNSVTDMSSTFLACYNLINAPVIPNSVTNMYETFYVCSNLVNAPAIPNSVTNMYHTFYVCTNLVNAPDMSNANNVLDLPETFDSCSSLETVSSLPNNVTNMYQTFNNCTNLVNAPVIPNSVTHMYQTFNGCSKLVNAPVIPNRVTNMYYTFNNCTNLVNAPVIPNNVTDISGVFYQCSNLSGDVHIYSKELRYISSCFGGTYNQKNVYIPYTYENGVNTPTYNIFRDYGYTEDGNIENVYLKNGNPKCVVTLNITSNSTNKVIYIGNELQESNVCELFPNTYTYYVASDIEGLVSGSFEVTKEDSSLGTKTVNIDLTSNEVYTATVKSFVDEAEISNAEVKISYVNNENSFTFNTSSIKVNPNTSINITSKATVDDNKYSKKATEVINENKTINIELEEQGEFDPSALVYGDRLGDGEGVATVVGDYTDGNGQKYKFAVLDAKYMNKLSWGPYGRNSVLPNYDSDRPIQQNLESATYNTDYITNYDLVSLYPAFNYCNNALSIELGGTVYKPKLPNGYELQQICNNKAYLYSKDPTRLDYTVYNLSNWSFNGVSTALISNEYNSYFSWVILSDGDCIGEFKDTECGVLPILEIPYE